MGSRLLPTFCALTLAPSAGYILHGAHRARSLSAETGPAAAAETPPRARIALPTSKHRRRRQRYLATRLHGTDSTSSASSPPSVSSPAASSPPLASGAFSGERGAEWAGWECRFSSKDGRPVPVPEDYVPETLREWDVEVWGFETLTSEQRRRQGGGEGKDKGTENKDKEGRGGVLYRKRGRVYPETGCALDNLTLEVNAQTSPLEGHGVFVAEFPQGEDHHLGRTGGGHILGKKVEGSTLLQLEVGIIVPFGVSAMTVPSPGGGGGGGSATGAKEEEEWSRARVEFRLERSSAGDGVEGGTAAAVVLGPTVTVTRERRYQDAFDDGLLYKGGGLDSQKLGRLLRSKCFAESETPPTNEDLAGEWVSRFGHWQRFRGSSDPGCMSTESPLDIRGASWGDVKTLLLPGGVTVRSGPWLDDQGAPNVWGHAAADDEAPKGEALWAVEVGWFVHDEQRAPSDRAVLTTLLDGITLAPLGAWRGEEKRSA